MKALVMTLGISLSLLIGGCAVSPQSVVVNPQASVSGPAYGQGRALAIEVEDRRASSVLGTRGGVYESSSVITIANSIDDALLLATSKAALQLGFDGTGSATPATMTVILDELNYDTKTQGIVNNISIDAKITIIVRVGGSSHTGHYQTQRSHKLTKFPNAQENQAFVNEVLSTSLERGFSDLSLANFLAQN